MFDGVVLNLQKASYQKSGGWVCWEYDTEWSPGRVRDPLGDGSKLEVNRKP